MSDLLDPLAPFRLDGRTAVLTGASSGIGARFAKVLHAAGAQVVVAARRVERLEELADGLDGVVPVACDVADPDSVEALVTTAIERFGRIDLLVNNAGITEPMPVEDEPLEVFRRVVDVNLTGLFHLSRQAGRHMLDQGSGVIVNVASVLGLVGAGQIPQASYAASKAGVVNLTREMALQWARRGVRVNAIAPGWFPSEMTADMFGDEGGQRWIRRNTPVGRGGELHELDGALLFLASDASTYVTGHTLVVDGGWTAR
ncbi:MAG TPA: glucose 1-dehydrogenase [Acidimicrobiales bacterium]|nr:glucose 1-dehydrogenase [Acidimicrobiales bacterium]